MKPTSAEDFRMYLRPAQFIDSDSPEVIKFAKTVCGNTKADIDKAIKLYYAVRDGYYYNPYRIDFNPDAMKASAVLARKFGFCVTKAILLAALARVEGIPSRLGFADVKNHLCTERLKELMQSDLFIFHGYVELYLEKQWIKATPAFNLSMCERFGVSPLEFDGRNDSIFHQFDRKGNHHMEYINDHGRFADLPYEQMIQAMKKHYPALFSKKNDRTYWKI